MALCASEVAFEVYGTVAGVVCNRVLKVGIRVEFYAGHDVYTGSDLYESGDVGGYIDRYTVGTYAYTGTEVVEYLCICRQEGYRCYKSDEKFCNEFHRS